MKKNRVWVGILFAVCILLSLIGIWKSVYVSADIDESYAFTMRSGSPVVSGCSLIFGNRIRCRLFCMPLLYGFIRASPEIWMVLLFLCALWGACAGASFRLVLLRPAPVSAVSGRNLCNSVSEFYTEAHPVAGIYEHLLLDDDGTHPLHAQLYAA